MTQLFATGECMGFLQGLLLCGVVGGKANGPSCNLKLVHVLLTFKTDITKLYYILSFPSAIRMKNMYFQSLFCMGYQTLTSSRVPGIKSLRTPGLESSAHYSDSFVGFSDLCHVVQISSCEWQP
jgi:hypothetical protein